MTNKSNIKPTRDQALKVARLLGSYGAHVAENGEWAPCKSSEILRNVLDSKPAGEVAKKTSIIEHRTDSYKSFSGCYSTSLEVALKTAKERGCTGIRVIMTESGRKYAPCVPKKFEKLRERGVGGIETLPDGGLVSSQFKDDITEIDAKGFVNYVSESTDPDVFTSGDSARKRSRQLGCIGIRSYKARDGKIVYLPCTNSPDHNNALNIGVDGRPKKPKVSGPRKRTGESFVKKSSGMTDFFDSRSTLSASSGLPSTDIAKKINKRKRMNGKVYGFENLELKGLKKPSVHHTVPGSLAKEIALDSQVVNSLAEKTRKHNAEAKKASKEDWSSTNLRTIKSVYMRGVNAHSMLKTSDISAKELASKRVTDFMKMLLSGKPEDQKYKSDNDLLPENHPWKKNKKTQMVKSLMVDDVEYFATPEMQESGFAYGTGSPRKVKRQILFTAIDAD
jgi:hypothetical protein